MQQQENQKYTLGIDVGIASVGAALLTDDKILGLHVRTFDEAEVAKTGESLNLIRREARSTRRRLHRRKFRLLRLCRLLKRKGLIAQAKPDAFYLETSAWQLRSEGLDRKLGDKEWATVLYHIVKHRGFQSNRKSELENKDMGQMLSGVRANKEKREENNYRTIGEMIWKDASFKDAKRNKGSSYKNTIGREELQKELSILFDCQREQGNQHAGQEFEQDVKELLMARRPTFTDDDIEKMVGKCTFEKDEKRAAKGCYSATQFIWYGKLNNMRVRQAGYKERELTLKEKQKLKNLPFELAGGVSFVKIRKELGLSEDYHCNLVNFDREDKPIFKAEAYHKVRKAYDKAGYHTQWEDKVKDDFKLLDKIITILTNYRDDESIKGQLPDIGIVDNDLIESLLPCEFTGHINLSLKALYNIVPYMEEGLRYDEACYKAGYHHSNLVNNNKKGKLPAPNKDEIKNPVVLRSLNQACKLINAIIDKYGNPSAIHIEMVRDLAKSFKDRKQIEKKQVENRKNKEELTKEYIRIFGEPPRGIDVLKMRLYKEQDGKCAYSLKPIDINRLTELNYVEVDHIIPYSRCFDSRMTNQTLVLTEQNRNKGNKTPYEFMGSDDTSQHWRTFKAWVEGNPKIYKAKKEMYLCKEVDEEGFKERNKSDTSWVGRELKKMIEDNIIDRCVVLNGRLTAMVRGRWGLNKVRSNGDKHHAMDAAVVAATTRSMIQRISYQARWHELKSLNPEDYIDLKTGELTNIEATHFLEGKKESFPEPFEDFKEDLLAGLKKMRVSRAPIRKSLGAAHQETIRANVKDAHQKYDKGEPVYYSSYKTPIDKLQNKDLENIVGYNDPRNKKFMEAIAKQVNSKDLRMVRHKQEKEDLRAKHKIEWDELKAQYSPEKVPQEAQLTLKVTQKERQQQLSRQQEQDSALYMPAGAGKTSPRVRSVKLLSTREGKSGTPVRNGVANNASMIRVDIFTKPDKNGKNQHFGVPIYVSDVVKDELPNKAAPNGEVMDDSYQFLFSLYKNDWVELKKKDKTIIAGYYQKFDTNTGSVHIAEHDRDPKKGTDKDKEKPKNPGVHRSLGIKTASLQKYHVDILGNLYTAKAEQRQPLHKNQQI